MGNDVLLCSLQVLFHTVETLMISGFSLVNIESLINSLITRPQDILLKVLILPSVVPGTRLWLLGHLGIVSRFCALLGCAWKSQWVLLPSDLVELSPAFPMQRAAARVSSPCMQSAAASPDGVRGVSMHQALRS